MKIQGGYILIARQYDYSAIAHAPPLVQVIFLWLLRHAYHSDRRYCGNIIRRGQCLTSYKEIQEGLYWMVGFRKQKPTKHQCEGSMKWLKNAAMVATKKTTRGFIVTICNYDKYQSQKNYKRSTNATQNTERAPQCADTINKHYKHLSIETEKERVLSKFQKPNVQEVSEYAEGIGFELDGRRFVDFYESKGWMVGKNKMRDWRAAVRTWKVRSQSATPCCDLPVSPDGKEGKYDKSQSPTGRPTTMRRGGKPSRRRDYTHEPRPVAGRGGTVGEPTPDVTILKA
jgi:hypothetical protein